MNSKRILAATLLSVAIYTAKSQPVINTQPQSQTNVAGTTAMFSVQASGTEPLSYQWQYNAGLFNGANLTDETNSALVLPNVQSANAGNYGVVVTNVDGAITSAVATLTVITPPKILAFSPTNLSVSLGARPSFNVTASGTPPFYYFLRFNETDLPGKTNASSILSGVVEGVSMQTTNDAQYTLILTNLAGAITSRVATVSVDPTFTKITSGILTTDPQYGVACAWGDYDNDGFIDLLVTCLRSTSGVAQRNVLYHNNTNGTFTKITNTVITAEARDWRGCAWADYDNDGFLDLFVTSSDVYGFAAQNELFRNNGDGTFSKMTTNVVGAIVSTAAGGSQGCIWADYDRDGFVDLYIARHGADWLFHNLGDGTFNQAPQNTIIPWDNQDGERAMWGDYDNDGWPDLFVPVNTPSPCAHAFLYHGLGNGTFTNVLTSGVVSDCSSSACAWGDYDNDGFLDLFLAGPAGQANLLYHNNGDGTFTKMTSNLVGAIADVTAPVGNCVWGDYDNDGFLDLFLTTAGDGSTPTTNYLYHNNGDGTFTRVLTGSLVNDQLLAAFGCAWGDYDNDGFLDLFVPVSGSVPTPGLLYRNNGNSNAWLKVKLVGIASNRSAIGAKVRVQATIRGKLIWQLREINAGDGFGMGPLEAHFGLGDATNINQVRIEWPSGIVQTLTNVAPKEFLTVVEHQPAALNPPSLTSVTRSVNGILNLQAVGDNGLLYVLEATTNLVNWTKIGVRSNATGTVAFIDPRSTNYASRFYRVTIP